MYHIIGSLWPSGERFFFNRSHRFCDHRRGSIGEMGKTNSVACACTKTIKMILLKQVLHEDEAVQTETKEPPVPAVAQAVEYFAVEH